MGILSLDNIKESANIFERMIRSTKIYDDFLYSNTKNLQHIDSLVSEATTTLYKSLLESSTTEQECEQFSIFFKKYVGSLEELCMRATEFKDEFSIRIETLIDANNELINHTSIPSINNPIQYNGKSYTNLLKSDLLPMDIYDVFKKEFVFIGKMMQDLDTTAPDQQKVEIISTICNNLSKEINDGWLDKAIQKMTGSDDADRDSFAKKIYKLFVKDSGDMDIDNSDIEQCKLALSNYGNYILSLCRQLEELCDSLDKVSSELKSLLFRNKDYKMVIQTKEDGIKDATYRLSKYSFNQFNIFITTKISQITELYNIYMTALSIKADCIYGYLNQCKEILEIALKGDDKSATQEEIEDTDNDTGSEDVDNDLQDIENPSNQEDEDTSDNTSEEDNKEESSDDTDEAEIETECYLFETELYNMQRAIQQYTFVESMSQYIVEDHIDAGSGIKNVGKNISNIIKRILEMIQKFIFNFDKTYKKRAEFMKANRDKIMKTAIPENTTIQRLDIKPLVSFSVIDFNESDAGLLEDKASYLSSKYPQLVDTSDKEAKSIKSMILKKLLDQNETPYTNNDRNDGYNFIVNGLTTIRQNIESAKNKLSKYQNNTIGNQSTAQNQDSKQESFLYSIKNTYFTEADNEQQNNGNALATYISITSELIMAVANVTHIAFNKHDKFLTQLSK